ncbi:hypothetical protein V9T40_007614 [Parthenolecanium corni]|uniref:Uncharacterized protein n=1 Tax=Parthenolecanium corni TaxID=536013 RepID=A0AAN9TJM0_9HEMI
MKTACGKYTTFSEKNDFSVLRSRLSSVDGEGEQKTHVKRRQGMWMRVCGERSGKKAKAPKRGDTEDEKKFSRFSRQKLNDDAGRERVSVVRLVVRTTGRRAGECESRCGERRARGRRVERYRVVLCW